MTEAVIPPEACAVFAALHRSDPAEDLLALTDSQWDRLLRFSDLAHLTLPLARAETLKVPAWVRDRLDTNLRDNRDRFRLVRETFEEADSVLRKAGVEYVVIKGFTLSPEFVKSPWLRQQSDLDFYCEADRLELAQRTLASIGYCPNTTIDFSGADHAPTLYRLGDWRWAGNAFDPEMPLSIELHFSMWNEKVTLLPGHEIRDFYQRRQIRVIEGMHVPVLDDIDILGHFSMHILRDLLAYGTPIHHLYELAEFIERKASREDFWLEWQRQHSDALRAKEVIAFDLARRCFGCPIPEHAQEVLDRLPRQQSSWLERFGQIPLEIPFRECKDAVWLHWSLLKEDGGRSTLIRRAFFPNRLPNPDFEPLVLEKRMTRESRRKSFLLILIYGWKRIIAYSKLNLRTISHGAMWVLRSRCLFGE
jgi:hypothetical protein